jgi:hypothetical protein
MTKAGYTHFTIIADRTGSMGMLAEGGRTRAEDTTTGIQELVKAQGTVGETTFSLVQFMSMPGGAPQIERVAWFAPADYPALTGWVCTPYGGTPLLDAIGIAVADTGDWLANMPEYRRPERVMIVIGTDGEENTSREYSLKQIRDMVTHQQEAYKWDFLFIGAGLDTFADAGAMGIPVASTMNNAPGRFQAAYVGTNSVISRARAGGQSVSSVGYTDSERADAGGK